MLDLGGGFAHHGRNVSARGLYAAMHRVFVFGTLKEGFPLHHQGLGDTPKRLDCHTVERYPMFVAGAWYAPMMMNEPGSGRQVRGELYEVDDAGLARLDAVESVGKPGNWRIVIDVEALDGSAYVKSGCSRSTSIPTGLTSTTTTDVPFDRRRR